MTNEYLTAKSAKLNRKQRRAIASLNEIKGPHRLTHEVGLTTEMVDEYPNIRDAAVAVVKDILAGNPGPGSCCAKCERPWTTTDIKPVVVNKVDINGLPGLVFFFCTDCANAGDRLSLAQCCADIVNGDKPSERVQMIANAPETRQ